MYTPHGHRVSPLVSLFVHPQRHSAFYPPYKTIPPSLPPSCRQKCPSMACPTRSRADHHLESSNSTASIFLGGVRRTWMPNSSQPNPATLPSKRPERYSIPTPTSQYQSQAASAQTDRDHPPVLSGTTTTNTQSLMSPVTPGANLQLQQNQPCPPTTISIPSASHSPATALPSPVPSTISHVSPAEHNHGPTNSATRAAQACTGPAPTTPPANGEPWSPQP